MPNLSTNLWFDKDVHAAIDFYVSLVPNSALGRVTTLPAESPAGPADSVTVIEFTLGGQRFTAMEAGPLDPFNHAFSISVYCETQSEIDRIWHGFLDNGGTEEQCGWLRDRWGVCWQIVPQMLGDLISDTDRARARRVTEAMLGMIKLDIAALQAAGG
jgi:predicted 3-demethylubiquinone-9 3-methyltransferase (glyoxalase superfamily)